VSGGEVTGMNTTMKALFAAAALTLAAPILVASGASAQPFYKAPPAQDFDGVWMIQNPPETLKTVDGKLPAMSGEASKIYKEHLAARKAGKPDFDTIQACMPHGFPRILTASYPIEIFMEPKQVTFIHEVHHFPRLVFLDAQPVKAEDRDQNWMGFSTGKWDGDTLVVFTAGFNDKTVLDTAGLPHTTDLEVTERIRKTGADTLEDLVTYHDPKMYSKDWSTKLTYKRQPARARLAEYVCTDKNPEIEAKK
jgi:hypothetical protein